MNCVVVTATEVEEFFYEDCNLPVSQGQPIGVEIDRGPEVEFLLFEGIYWKPYEE